MSDGMTELMALALELAELGSKVQREHLGSRIRIEAKSSPTDLVSDVDREAEQAIVSRLLSRRPNDGLLAEESGSLEGGTGVCWIIDPLDGTMNFFRGYPSFGCSIAVTVDDRPLVGVVTDTVRDVAYTGIASGGGSCDGHELRLPPPPPTLADAIVSTGLSYDAAQRRQQGLVLAAIVDRIADIRRAGAAALDLCQLANGWVDAYFELDLARWDYAAGAIIVEAAGGQVVELPATHGKGPAIVAAHPALLPALTALLEEAGALRPEQSGDIPNSTHLAGSTSPPQQEVLHGPAQ
jgi:myo-inositol-1(or 4)-monophosphatase